MPWLLLALSCAVSRHPTAPATVPGPSASSWEQVLSGPGVLEHTGLVAARGEVPLSGLVNLDHPAAAGLEDRKVPIVVPLHVLKHPTRGLFVVDTGIPDDIAAGGHGPARGLARRLLKTLEPVEGLGAVLARAGGPVGGALITHAHTDHILGLQDLPESTPVYMGPGELAARRPGNGALRRSTNATLEDITVLEWPFQADQAMAPTGPALDVLGDGSLWAISVSGHTPGSTAYLAMTTAGPMLFTGDCSHTRWGWEQGVEPGNYTDDQSANAVSLGQLRELVQQFPQITVWVGHELDGEGTGVE